MNETSFTGTNHPFFGDHSNFLFHLSREILSCICDYHCIVSTDISKMTTLEENFANILLDKTCQLADVPTPLNHTLSEIVEKDLPRLLLQICSFREESSAQRERPLPPTPFVTTVHDVKRTTRGYQHQRHDFLRRLLYAYAPIAMDVAVRVLETYQEMLDQLNSGDEKMTDNEDAENNGKSVLLFLSVLELFSLWLPLAPQLSFLVRDFLATRLSSRSFQSIKLPSHRLRVARAMYALTESLQSWVDLTRHLTANDWETPLYNWLMDEPSNSSEALDCYFPMIRYYVARVLANAMGLPPVSTARFLEQSNAQTEGYPSFEIHPWSLRLEQRGVQLAFLQRRFSIWNEYDFVMQMDDPENSKRIIPDLFDLPTAQEMRAVFPLDSPYLVDIVEGLTFCKLQRTEPTPKASLYRTPTTIQNLQEIGLAMAAVPPYSLLLEGPHGSGKSSLVREIANFMGADLMELHIDEETDTKTLIGSYTTTEIPGRFEWRAGALTQAVRTGKWVLMEDLDNVPTEIQASLVQLFKERILSIGNGDRERCHPNFRIFATRTVEHTNVDDDPRPRGILNPKHWCRRKILPLPLEELRQLSSAMYPSIPLPVMDASLSLYTRLVNQVENSVHTSEGYINRSGRNPSIRDFFKVLSRISGSVHFESNTSFVTEGQRTLCLAESVDVFAGAQPDFTSLSYFVRSIASPVWDVSPDLAFNYVFCRTPEILRHPAYLQVGRGRISLSGGHESPLQTSRFAQTSYSLRFLEAICVGVRECEPVLLVGETGCGKTTILQHLAQLCGRELVVLNLSLQTDSSDLLGGYRPLEMMSIATTVYNEFVDLFTSTFSRNQNAKFLDYASQLYRKKLWKKLSQCFSRASKMGLDKVSETEDPDSNVVKEWSAFTETVRVFEKQRHACDTGLAFSFVEGALVEAIRHGKWVLLDEINLASSECLQRISGLLDGGSNSVTLTERGDARPVLRHADFKLFAAMNPATDAGKKDLSWSLRSRFTEIYVPELLDHKSLRNVASRYFYGSTNSSSDKIENLEEIATAVSLYLGCRDLAETTLADGSGQKPRFSLRSFTRALSAANTLVLMQGHSLGRALVEGFELSFESPLSKLSRNVVRSMIMKGFPTVERDQMKRPGRRPGGRSGASSYVLVEQFWIERGPMDPVDLSDKGQFILTESTKKNLRRLARAVACGPWPVLLEGPTSAGKTSLIQYFGALCGHKVIRINNHEHTEVQEYTGSFTSTSSGSLSFKDGILVSAMKEGHWVILDELNLAPSEVLEALNRLLDDNRELYIPEINTIVQPHANFRLFATQNPSGIYGGRKPLSRAFRNRFVELHLGDIPTEEMTIILQRRCSMPETFAKILVRIMEDLRAMRNQRNIFLGRDGLVTPRDLLRWAHRNPGSKLELAEEGYMLLAERLRSEAEKSAVKDVIQKHTNVVIDIEKMYYSEDSENVFKRSCSSSLLLDSHPKVAMTKSLRRLLTLIWGCWKQKEPVLLVGETGCGKTTAVQLLSVLTETDIHIVNCHATTETSDLLGSLRPVRGRTALYDKMCRSIRLLLKELDMNGSLDLSIPEELRGDLGGKNIPPDRDIMNKMKNIVEYVKETITSKNQGTKRRKLETTPVYSNDGDLGSTGSLRSLVDEFQSDLARYNSLFEWQDGPLVLAMTRGDLLLLDEMSLAEDAVLERLNSVLEPSRTLVLAEKSGGSDQISVQANENFQLYATMNPGGDFGKRELSPALRSRFTEVWVPPVDSKEDIVVVLDCVLGSVSFPESLRKDIRDSILEYFLYYNEYVCGDPGNPLFGLQLSLRDITTWADFIVKATEQKCESEESVWKIYYEGCFLMHLDGLGLGASVRMEDALAVRTKAASFLRSQGGLRKLDLSHTCTIKEDLETRRFGCDPFWIDMVPRSGDHKECIDFNAPTTSLNCYRVLRAMQLKKPILLEGSPGVGKTSLISSLASYTGHQLVRINLSEQTDISDLFGSDLPIPGSSDGSTTGTNFQWCDGILLSAIKKGDWVLLDELNLASQSVLEGLNSCLDHRATVYIPELGQSFVCPPTFRVFAAQNPLVEGGGRKGLPKSFLNRFSKVFVEALSSTDLLSIVATRYPSFDRPTVDSIIKLNSEIHNDVVVEQKYGHAGRPWEFNLRDICRFSDFLNNGSSLESALRYLYTMRFRESGDKNQVEQRISQSFPTPMVGGGSSLVVSLDSLQIGPSKLPVSNPGADSKFNLGSETPFLRRNERVLEAVAKGVQMGLPCLLVGSSLVGKGSIPRVISMLGGSKFLEIDLSPSSDVSELVGTFEQEGWLEQRVLFIDKLSLFCDQKLILAPYGSFLRDLHVSTFYIRKCSRKDERNLAMAVELYEQLKREGFEDEELDRIYTGLVRFPSNQTGRFVWKDGPLVRAMKEGHSLHLKNVNLCPASILDRLNSVLEPNGFLMLAENGATDPSDTIVRCHPNFRVFLSMNPEYGEVSRAMRNRCFEIFLDDDDLEDTGKVLDTWSIFSLHGLRVYGSHEVSGLKEPTNQIAGGSMATYTRGFLSPSTAKRENGRNIGSLCSSHPVLFGPSTRLVAINTDCSVFEWGSGLLESLFYSSGAYLSDVQLPIPLKISEQIGSLLCRPYKVSLSDVPFDVFRNTLLGYAALTARTGSLSVVNGDIHGSLSFLQEALLHSNISPLSALSLPCLRHFCLKLRQAAWEANIEPFPQPENLQLYSVLHVSEYIARGRVGEEVAPMLLRRISRFFSLLNDFETNPSHSMVFRSAEWSQFSTERYTLWKVLLDTPWLGLETGLRFGFEEFLFVTQWIKASRSLERVGSVWTQKGIDLDEISRIVSEITRDIVGGSSGGNGESLLRFSRSIVPKTAEGWELLLKLQNVSHTMVSFPLIQNWGETVSLSHPFLYLEEVDRRDLLSAITTIRLHTSELSVGFQKSCSSSLREIFETVEKGNISKENSFRQKVNILFQTRDFDITATSTTRYAEYREAVANFREELLLKAGDFQFSCLIHHMCLSRGMSILSNLSSILTENNFSLMESTVILTKDYIETAVHFGLIEPHDLWPFQLLVWMDESSECHGTCFRDQYRLVTNSILHIVSKQSVVKKNQVSRRLLIDPMISISFHDSFLPTPSKFGTVEEESLHLPEIIEAVLAIVGKISRKGSTSTLSLENRKSRRRQINTIIMAMRIAEKENNLNTALPLYVLRETVEILREYFDEGDFQQIVKELGSTSRTIVPKVILDSFRRCQHPWIKANVAQGSIMSILIEKVSLKEYRDKSSEAEVFILLGIFLFHLYLPSSPVDPGLSALAEVSSAKEKLVTWTAEVGAIHFLNSLPKTTNTDLLILEYSSSEGNEYVSQLLSWKEKIISRPGGTQGSFVELYQILHDASSRFLSVDSVLEVLRFSSIPEEESHYKVRHWVGVARALFERIEEGFPIYEDVTQRMNTAISLMIQGVSFLSSAKGNQDPVGRFISTSFTYPVAPSKQGLSEAFSTVDSLFLLPSLSNEAKQAGFFGILYRLPLLNEEERNGFGLYLFRRIVDRLIGEVKDSPDVNRIQNFIDLPEESDLKSQFPDFHSEFRSLLTTPDEGIETESDEKIFDSEGKEIYLDLSGCRTLVKLHKILIHKYETKAMDNLRAEGFLYDMKTVKLFVEEGLASARLDGKLSSGGVLMALASNFCKETMEGIRPYHSQFMSPNVKEGMKLEKPLENLAVRISYLLSLFPENEILMALSRVTEHLLRLDLLSTSTARLMAGCETILTHAQDWEQHASQHALLGSPLKDISALVTEWRKLELASWNELLADRERKHKDRTAVLWPMFSRIVTGRSALRFDFGEDTSGCTVSSFAQKWVLKEFPKVSSPECLLLDTVPTELDGIVKILDTFIQSASLAEFDERLSMIRTFAEQLWLEYRQDKRDLTTFTYFSVFFSTYRYYHQFEDLCTKKKNDIRQPVEKKIREEIALARWDEQNYYALKETSQKNHMKLIEILRSFDDEISIKIGSLLELEMNKGIRTASSEANEPCTSIPSDIELFPLKENFPIYFNQHTTLKPTRELSSYHRVFATQDIPPDSRCFSIDRYTRIMKSFIDAGTLLHRETTESITVVGTFVESIFNRIRHLRESKSSRPMKERGLRDLFQRLKEEGYKETSWSLPHQVRRITEIFASPPIVNFTKDTSGILNMERADLYFYRNVAEASRMRSEISTLGSRHMGTRESGIFISVAEDGVLCLLLQRFFLHKATTQFFRLWNIFESTCCGNLTPKVHRAHGGLLSSYQKEKFSATESFQQLLLLLQLLPELVESERLGLLHTLKEKLSYFCDMLSAGVGAIRINRSSCIEDIEKDLHLICETRRNIQSSLDHLDDLSLPEGPFLDSLLVLDRLERAATETISSLNTFPYTRISKNDFLITVSEAVSHVLVQAQKFQRGVNEKTESSTLHDQNKFIMGVWSTISLDDTCEDLETVLRQYSTILSCDESSDNDKEICSQVFEDYLTFLENFLSLVGGELRCLLKFHEELGKFHYILVRIFRTLLSKGFCSDAVSDEGDPDGEMDTNGMSFTEQDGTGMGEGEGKTDVTDQIENEEQLLGLKNEKEEESKDQQSRQLDEEEAEKGMEMEADFDGEDYDVPENKDSQEDQDEDEEEELDREMGEGGDKDDVVDERLWDENDTENEQNEGVNPLEEESNVEGAQGSDEITTKDNETENQKTGEKEEPQLENKNDTVEEAEEEDLNENGVQNEEAYEENHGIDLKPEEKKSEINEEGDAEMEIDDQLDMDSGNEEGLEDDTINPEDREENLTEMENTPMEGDTSDGEEENPEGKENTMDGGIAEIEEAENDAQEEQDNDPSHVDETSKKIETDQGLGVHAADGVDMIHQDENQEDMEEEPNTSEQDRMDDTMEEKSRPGGPSSDGKGESHSSTGQQSSNPQQPEQPESSPNPLTHPQQVEEYWRKRLNVIQQSLDVVDEGQTGQEEDPEREDRSGDFEFVTEQQASTTETLAESKKEDPAVEHLPREEEPPTADQEPKMDPSFSGRNDEERSREKKSHPSKDEHTRTTHDTSMEDAMNDSKDDDDENSQSEDERSESNAEERMENDSNENPGNAVVSDLSKLHVSDTHPEMDIYHPPPSSILEEEVYLTQNYSSFEESRRQWTLLQNSTNALSRRLCEKLRLVLEPLVASKLRGDYRTGKRLHMKKVLGYIASGYRRDKIWLRRTKPAKRNYRVLIALDDSESMRPCRTQAWKALATVVTGLTQLEVGEVGIASFGEEMKVVHSWESPWTSEIGGRVYQEFGFRQSRTRISLCLESVMKLMMTSSSSTLQSGVAAPLQLVFLITDGRIERDSRSTVRRLLREMMEGNILVAMIIVESSESEQSILNLKEVSFGKGTVTTKSFMEDYPFPYYVVLKEMDALPELLGDAVKQWFEMMSRLQS